MPWERKVSSARRLQLTNDWYAKVRPRILRRDHYHCRWGLLEDEHFPLGMCPTRANQVDHIGDNADHRDANLRALCQYHHGVRSGRQGAAASHAAMAERKALRAHPEEPHPGGRR